MAAGDSRTRPVIFFPSSRVTLRLTRQVTTSPMPPLRMVLRRNAMRGLKRCE